MVAQTAVLAQLFLLALAGRVVDASGHAWEWSRHATSVPDAHLVPLTVALAPASQSALDAAFMRISTPSHPSYNQHMSFDDIVELTSDDATVSAVTAWLKESCGAGDIAVSPGRDWLTTAAPKTKVETCLDTSIHRYTPAATARAAQATDNATDIVRAESYTIPNHLNDKIITISSLTRFPRLNKLQLKFSTSMIGDSTNVTTPELLSTFYSISLAPINNTKSTQAVYEQGQSFIKSDLAAFQKKYGVNKTPVSKIVGTANDPGDCDFNPGPCIEGEMDTQYISAMAASAPLTYYAYDESSSYSDYIKAVSNDKNCALVHSMSYGWNEYYEDPGDMKAFNVAVQKLALRGVSVLASTGDDGVANQRAREDDGYCGFYPSFPASSPYVLAVGATRGPESHLPSEIVCSARTGGDITSGGGFSGQFARPAWQNTAVQHFLSTSKSLPAKKDYSPSGRGYPDVSLLGFNYQVCVADACKRPYQVSGTSASCPVMAGLITRANSLRLNANKRSLGALGPAMYSLFDSQPGLFHDITSGDNKCTAICPRGECPQVRLTCCDEGFTAQKGWDAVSGMGSVGDWGKLEAALVAL